MHFAGELGLLSIAFSPTYATDHFVYAYYVNRKVRVISQCLRRVQGQAGDGGGGRRPRCSRPCTSRFDDHNGGQLAFGPDGKLYAATGDGGGSGDPLHSGQTPKSKLGKLLRAAGPTFKTWQIAGFGFRNPWRSRSTARTATCTSATSGR